MKVTREVIYDLLPAYFAGDVSADTRALVEEYFASDPEFGRMATRFQSLLAERQAAKPADSDETDREREAFQRAREAAELPQKTRAAALAFGFAALFSFGMAFLTWRGPMRGLWNPGVILGAIFAVSAVVTFALSFRIQPDSWWRNLAGLDDDTLRSVGYRGRSGKRRAGA
jgi:anti-sigma factor RsiW